VHSEQRTVADLVAERWPGAAAVDTVDAPPARPEPRTVVRPRTPASTRPPARRVERTVADLVAEAWPEGAAPVLPGTARHELRDEPDQPGTPHRAGLPEPREASALESVPAGSPVEPPAGRGERTVADLVAERWGAAAATGAVPTDSPDHTSFFDSIFGDEDFEDDDEVVDGGFGTEYLPDDDRDDPADRAAAKQIPSLEAARVPTRRHGLPSVGRLPLVDAVVTRVNTGLRRPDGTRRTLSPWLAGPGAAATVLVATLVAGIAAQSDGTDDSSVTGANAASSSDAKAAAGLPPNTAAGPDAAAPGVAAVPVPDAADKPNQDKYASGRKTGDASANALSKRGLDIGVRNGPIDCARPGRILNLDSWKLTLPIGAASKPTEIRGGRLGSYSTDYFKVGQTCNAVAFKAPVNGVTTSGSKNPRSELREMTGGSNAGWSSTSGSHTMVLTEAFTTLPVGKPQVVGGQIHDADDDVSVFRLEGSNLYVTNGDDTHYQLVTSKYVLGTPFEAKYVVSGGVIRAYYNGQLVATINKAFSGAYFKAGAYTQANCGNSSPCTSANYGEVLVYALKVTHTP